MNTEIAKRIEGRCNRLINRAIQDIPTLHKDKNYKALVGVIKGLCRDSLQLGMLTIRSEERSDSGIEIISKPIGSVELLLSIPENELHPSDFIIPIYLCLLCGEFELATALAKKAVSDGIKIIAGNHFDVHGKMLAYFILRDAEKIKENEEKLFKLSKNYWWEKLRLYFELYMLVALDDQSGFTKTLNRTTANMESREKDKKFGDQLGEYGGLEYNQFVLDFMALGIASYASYIGFNVDFQSKYFPSEIIEGSIRKNA